ncbi:MAG TPA: hypothetical protein ENI65_03975 [Gammaproteobacteria bacterium]|nr:hypothetical protein [Gammaproteobacteria bacterium]
MTGIIFFRLHQDNSTDWYLPEDESGRLAQYGSSLSDATELCRGKKVVVFIPGSCVHLSTHLIPVRSRQKILQAIPFTMEDELIGDVDEFHFAIPARTPQNNIPVCAVSHEKMEMVLSLFHDADIQPQVMTPDLLALPLQTNHWTILVENNETSTLTGQFSGFTVDTNGLDTCLELAMQETEDNMPAKIDIIDFRTLDTDIKFEIPGFDPDNITITHPAGNPITLLAENYTDAAAINLLQGTYATRKVRNPSLRKWYPALTVLAIMLFIKAASGLIEYRRISNEINLLDRQIKTTFNRALPDVRRMVNPRVQMEQRLKQLRHSDGQGKTGFLAMLDKSAKALKLYNKITLKGINFRNDQLDMEFTIGDLQKLEKLKQAISLKGMKVEIRSAAVQGNVVSARLRIREAE